jgi:hypothetical protein
MAGGQDGIMKMPDDLLQSQAKTCHEVIFRRTWIWVGNDDGQRSSEHIHVFD